MLDVATEAGANAVPIVLLTGFLMGVIIAFEIGLVAQKFGAVIFVVNGVGIAMLRELGPLMTAIVFAGRTGAAFAAQIGTQKVNEEVNAISTFGLDPIPFLVLPRLLAAMLVLPLLAVIADVVGLFGGALVMSTFDVSLVQFCNQLLGAVSGSDFVLGIVKAAVFGLTIAAVGCQRGLATGAGATAVGLSATSAVVTSIVPDRGHRWHLRGRDELRDEPPPTPPSAFAVCAWDTVRACSWRTLHSTCSAARSW